MQWLSDNTCFENCAAKHAPVPAWCYMQVAVKKLPTSQVPAQEFRQFLQFLETLAFATKTCNKLCRLLGFTVKDGCICQVLPLYAQSLQQLMLTGDACLHIICVVAKQLHKLQHKANRSTRTFPASFDVKSSVGGKVLHLQQTYVCTQAAGSLS